MAPEAQAAILTGGFLIVIEAIKIGAEKYKAHKKPDLSDTDYDDLIGEIIQGIQIDTQAHRVAYWAAQNGEKTLDGYSIKKLSMMVEKNAEGVDNIIRDMQNVPSTTFKRTLSSLRLAAEPHVLSNESEIQDDLGRVNTAYGCNTMLVFKVNNIRRGKKWTGLLCIGFEERMRNVLPTEIGFCALQVSRIEALISKL